MKGIEHISHVLSTADSTDWAEGLVAYPRYRAVMQSFADHYQFTLAQVTAAFCALSPNNDYKGNIKSMATVLHGIRAGWALDDITVTTYNACRNRAYRFATGAADFLTATKGPKTRNFYQNILDPSDPHPVTVDGHMLSVWQGQRMTMVEAVRARIPYNDVAHGIRVVAFQHMLLPNQVQAILWFAWKRMHEVIYTPQLHLFQDGDQWSTEVQPRSIKPFSRREA